VNGWFADWEDNQPGGLNKRSSRSWRIRLPISLTNRRLQLFGATTNTLFFQNRQFRSLERGSNQTFEVLPHNRWDTHNLEPRRWPHWAVERNIIQLQSGQYEVIGRIDLGSVGEPISMVVPWMV